MTKAEQIRKLAAEGMKRSHISRKVGCSRAYVTIALRPPPKIPLLSFSRDLKNTLPSARE